MIDHNAHLEILPSGMVDSRAYARSIHLEGLEFEWGDSYGSCGAPNFPGTISYIRECDWELIYVQNL